MEKQTIRIRRVGTVTFGVVLIITGVLYLAHLFLSDLNYIIIFRLWPIILIMLGLEVLAASRQKIYEVLDSQGKITEQNKVIYDFPAILLMIVLTVFSIGMAAVEYAYTVHHFNI